MERRSFYIDKATYATLRKSLNNLHVTERKGNISDFEVYINDKWLAHAAVIEQLTCSQGEWQVELLFASIQNPLKFIKQRITSSRCPRQASKKAKFMRRRVAKGRPLTVSVDQLTLCFN